VQRQKMHVLRAVFLQIDEDSLGNAENSGLCSLRRRRWEVSSIYAVGFD